MTSSTEILQKPHQSLNNQLKAWSIAEKDFKRKTTHNFLKMQNFLNMCNCSLSWLSTLHLKIFLHLSAKFYSLTFPQNINHLTMLISVISHIPPQHSLTFFSCTSISSTFVHVIPEVCFQHFQEIVHFALFCTFCWFDKWSHSIPNKFQFFIRFCMLL
jgi:hypothetical protein